jgi:hypothetical protein
MIFYAASSALWLLVVVREVLSVNVSQLIETASIARAISQS